MIENIFPGNSNASVMKSLENLIDKILVKLSDNKDDIDEMNFDKLLSTIQTLTKTVQNFIKIIELSTKNAEAEDEENNFIDKIVSDEISLSLAQKLLERLQE